MTSRLPRLLAVVALVATAVVVSQVPAPAAVQPTATLGTAGCVDGARVAKVELTAADAAATTFTTVATRTDGTEVFRDDARVVPAGTAEKVSVTGLTFGSYDLVVEVGGDQIFSRFLQVRCTPVGDYKNPGVGGGGGCDGETTFYVTNEPIPNAPGDLLPVRFTVLSPSGVERTVLLPDDDDKPYGEVFVFERGQLPSQYQILIDGKEPPFPIAFAVPSCAPPVPNTGS